MRKRRTKKPPPQHACWILARLFLVSTFPAALANSFGAGRCVVGEPAPQGAHTADGIAITTGSLGEGGYTIVVAGEVVADFVTATVSIMESPINIVISGGNEFRGVQIHVDGLDDSAIEPGTNLQLNAFGENCVGLAAVTHQDSTFKSEASANVFFDSGIETTIDFNVVVSNSFGESEYYWSQVNLQVVLTS